MNKNHSFDKDQGGYYYPRNKNVNANVNNSTHNSNNHHSNNHHSNNHHSNNHHSNNHHSNNQINTKSHYEQQNNFKSRDKRVEDVKIDIDRNHLIDISDKRLFNYIMDENFKWSNVRYLDN
jgi:hypothetical protein